MSLMIFGNLSLLLLSVSFCFIPHNTVFPQSKSNFAFDTSFVAHIRSATVAFDLQKYSENRVTKITHSKTIKLESFFCTLRHWQKVHKWWKKHWNSFNFLWNQIFFVCFVEHSTHRYDSCENSRSKFTWTWVSC